MTVEWDGPMCGVMVMAHCKRKDMLRKYIPGKGLWSTKS